MPHNKLNEEIFYEHRATHFAEMISFFSWVPTTKNNGKSQLCLTMGVWLVVKADGS